MKVTSFLFVLLLLFHVRLPAQDFNLGFENWDAATLQDDSASYTGFPSMFKPENPFKGRPSGWGYAMNGSARTTDAASGNYAWVLYQWYENVPAAGLFSGNSSSYQLSDQVLTHFSQPLYGVSGKYKFIPDRDSPGTAYLKVCRYKNGADSLVLIACDSLLFAPADTYTSFSLPVVPDSLSLADSVSISFLTKGPYIFPNSGPQCYYLFLDDLEFHFSQIPSGTHAPQKAKKVSIFPNPHDKLIHLVAKGIDYHKSSFYLFSPDGSLVKAVKIVKSESEVDCSYLPANIYYAVIMEDNQVIYTQKLVKN